VWCVSHFGLFAIQAMQHPTHCEWGSGLYDNGNDPPDEVARQGGQSITRTTAKGAHDSYCPQQINLNKPRARRNYTQTA
jgi:hypothetical protein